MLKAILAVLVLAGYGLYSLASYFLPNEAPPPKPPVQATTKSAVTTDTASVPNKVEAPLPASPLSSLVERVGVDLREIPSKGCTQSVLTKEKANALLSVLPASLQSGLYQALELGEPVWSAQLYLGDDGTGVCLPSKNKLVMLPVPLPAGWSDWDMDSLKKKATDGAKALGEMGKSASRWIKGGDR